MKSFVRIQRGIPAESDPDKLTNVFYRTTGQLTSLDESLAIAVPGNHSSLPPTCIKFLTLARGLIDEIRKGTLEISAHPLRYRLAGGDATDSDDDEFELLNRFQIALSALSELAFLMQAGAEAGYNSLDWQERTRCNFVNRKQIALAFGEVMNHVTQFSRSFCGVPGLAQMDHTQTRLLRMMVQDEHGDNVISWSIVGAGTVVSIFVWKWAPPAAAAALKIIWGQAPRLFANATVLYGTRVAALSAEALLFNYAIEVSSSKINLPVSLLGSWSEHMSAIEVFLQSPVHAPDLELALLSRVHSAIFSEAMSSLSNWLPMLRDEEHKWGSVDKAVAHYQNQASTQQKERH